ncbi:MAG: hypothetical protein M3Y37_03760 [Chloroflexota bacterium]|nr:hypothetical protein [Chloroflexota bacterium]
MRAHPCRQVLTFIIALAALGPRLASAWQDPGLEAPLSPGLHLGYGAFAPVAPELQPALDERVAELTAAGMDVARVMVAWSEIEAVPGVFDFAPLDAQLARVPAGTRLFLTLAAADVDHYPMPPDLVFTRAAPEYPLDTPLVIYRYLTLLDELLPRLVADYGLFALSVANEPDNFLDDAPQEEIPQLVGFTDAVAAHVEERYPGLTVTVTLSGPGIQFEPGTAAALMAPLETVAFNWSCIDLATFTARGPETIPADIALMLEAAAGREILLQEVSCPSGYADRPSLVGATRESQAAWFAAFFVAIAAEPQFRAAFVLDLVDWPADLAAETSAFMLVSGFEEYAARYQEHLETWGLLTTDLHPKPAWAVLLDAL